MFLLSNQMVTAFRCISSIYQSNRIEGEYSSGEIKELAELVQKSCTKSMIDNMDCFVKEIRSRLMKNNTYLVAVGPQDVKDWWNHVIFIRVMGADKSEDAEKIAEEQYRKDCEYKGVIRCFVVTENLVDKDYTFST